MSDIRSAQNFIDEYYHLYNQFNQTCFRPALASLTSTLVALLDSKLLPSQRLRVRVETGRIKSRNRLLQKAQLPKYHDRIQKPSDVFTVIRDIVGTRVTCNTLSDVYTVVSIIKSAATISNPARTIHKLHDDWEDDYIKTPKESGYRAINLLIGVPIPQVDLLEPFVCEIQIRTLLQNAWGELTHEDTYKPGVKVPDLVQILSKRLATTLAVLDEIAQDLRNELEKIEIADSSQLPITNTSRATIKFDFAGQSIPFVEGETVINELPNIQQENINISTLSSTKDTDILNIDTLKQVYHTVFDEELDLTPSEFLEILSSLDAAGVNDASSLKEILETTSDIIDEVEEQFADYTLTDYGHILAAIAIHTDRNRGIDEAKKMLQSSIDEANEEKSFEEMYPVGRELFGTAVYVTLNYALVQLPDGDTGILHATQMKSTPGEYITVSEKINPGDTVRVRVKSVDGRDRRIELQLIRGDA